MRLIDADALIKTLNEEKIKFNADVNYFILNAPTIEAKSVIRCKDCAFYWYHKLKQDGTPDKRYNPSHCYYWGQGRNPNEYCSRAVSQVSLKNAIDEMIEEIKEEIEENERKRKEEL